MTEFAIEWKNVTFEARNGFWMRSKMILFDINLAVVSGTVMGLIGPNGAGKTTTIKLAAGLIKPRSGQVLICGQHALNTESRKRIGLLTEIQYIYPHLRLGEWLMMAAGLSGLEKNQRKRHVTEMLDLFQLSDKAGQMMRTLSKGQIQRAGLSQAMVHEPSILLLDEPMSGLDPEWRYRVQNILKDFVSKGGTLVFSSHIFSDIERISDQVSLINQGKLRWTGRLTDLNRRVEVYEVTCHCDHPEIFSQFVMNKELVQQPGGTWRFNIPVELKQQVIQLSAQGAIAIEELRPKQEKIEDLFFNLEHKRLIENQ